MAARSVSWFYFVILLCFAAAEALKGGFSAELIHRDSPKSPFYDPSETPFQRAGKAMRRSIARARGFRTNGDGEGDPSADISRVDGDYLINITIGTPPVSIMAIADTGSDLIWTQCPPCVNCYPQEAPMFNPKASTTYAEVQCDTDECRVFDKSTCSAQGSTCRYSVRYSDKSFSEGIISTDNIGMNTLTGSAVTFPGLVFGCGNNNGGPFHASGILGLSPGDASLISQIGENKIMIFSYCLVPFFSTSKFTSKIMFGSDSELIGSADVVTTPLFTFSPGPYFYVTLEGISINGKRFDVSGSSGDDEEDQGNMIIDSGTALTWLPSDLYRQIEPEVIAAIDLPRAKIPIDGYHLCYTSSGVLKGAPSITVHFTGADVHLNWYNTFFQVEENTACFTFVATDGQPMYGNLAQTNFDISFNPDTDQLSFQPRDCAN